MAYKQLNHLQRGIIGAMLNNGHTQVAIAKEIGVHKSTISREIKRNGFWRGSYKAIHAQAYTEDRHRFKNKFKKLTQQVTEFIDAKLKQEWSPDQISGYAKLHNLFSISRERIYQYILKDKKQGGSLYKHLRHQNKKYRKRYGSPAYTGPLKDRMFIDDRPSIVEDKSRIGDWEIDTIVGKNQKQAVLTIVERASMFVTMRKLEAKNSSLTLSATVDALTPYKEHVHTITGDNGSEFAKHVQIGESLEADFYFAHPYASWERGRNENTNGLVRQYIKKGSEFTHIDDFKLKKIADKLNSRPRKNLGYLTPNEIFHTMRAYKQ